MNAAVETYAETKDARANPVAARLGLWDAVSIIVGIVVGSSIYRTPPTIFANVSSAWVGLGAWVLGGALSLVGALVYAELASNDPRQGGDYVYLTRAWGPWAGFLFGWAQLCVIRSGSIGMMAFVFADYAVDLYGVPADRAKTAVALLAILAVVVLVFVNLLGSVSGKWAQNLLNLAKIVGLLAIVIAGLGYGSGLGAPTPARADAEKANFGLAMILILLAYGGWSDAAFVAAELRERRNIARSLVLGIVAITVIYTAVNAAFLVGLGLDGVRHAGNAVAAKVLAQASPLRDYGRQAMCLIVMVSALGAINGMVFTGSRVYASLGAEHPLFAWLGRWHPRLGSPHWALLAQTAFTLLMMLAAAGFETGKATLNTAVTAVGLPAIAWERYYGGGFDILFAATAPVFWAFFLMTGVSYFILRRRDGKTAFFALPFPWFPLLPAIFCLTCVYMGYSALTYAETLAVLGALPLALGLPLFWLSNRVARSA